VDDALNVAHRVKEAMRRPSSWSHEIFVTASIGISLYPEDGEDCNSLKYADTAMYHAKNCGKNNAKLYSSSLTMQIMSHVKLEVGLRKALQNDELYLLYQPQIDVSSAPSSASKRWCAGAIPTRHHLDRIHSAGRRNRADRADRRMGAAHGLPAGAPVADQRRPSGAHGREPVGQAVQG
jgi:predicted signal transduction protein with EAL and GGDEF domain